MKTVKYNFHVSTKYVGSEVSEDIKFEVEDDATTEEIEEIADDLFKDWLWENIDGGFTLSSEL